jgi:hypothetical protein
MNVDMVIAYHIGDKVFVNDYFARGLKGTPKINLSYFIYIFL